MYYTSRALRGAKERYPPIEKLAFALITVACKLRPYFQAHTIVVQMVKLLQKTMDNPDTVAWLVLWTIKLREFNIRYYPSIVIKAQALANFITEFTTGKIDD